MKKHLCLFLVLLTLFITPLYANTTKNIYLNNLLYQPIHSVVSHNNTTYISLDDLNQLLYGTYTQADQSLVLNLNGTVATITLDSRMFKVGNTSFTLSSPVSLINETIYLPMEFLDFLNYTYVENEDSLRFTTPTPYSSSTDQYKGHTFINPGDLKLTDLVKDASHTPDEASAFIQDAIKNNQYLIIPFKTPNTQLLNAIKGNLQTSLPMEIVVRQADFLSKTPTESTLKTIPITPVLDGQKISVAIEQHTLTSTFFELAFNPSDATNVIDSNKTFDAILMRLIYGYYRDYYHLKDDVHFSPVSIMEMKRSDTMHFKCYLDEVLNHIPIHYDMIISKQIHPDRISYVVDFVKLP